ncbi:ELL factor, partial [Piprites chloris]|nr:ELL factor [Piprites chloris]
CFLSSVRNYVAVVSNEQRQSYKDDFNAEYGEYQNLFAQIENTAKKFRNFNEQLKCVTQGSIAHQVKKDVTVK